MILQIMPITFLGRILRIHRDSTLGPDSWPMTQAEVAEALRARGVSIQTRTYSNIESGVIERPKPEVINALAKIFPRLTVREMVEAMGYEVETEIEDEEALAVLRAYQAAEDGRKELARLALQLTPEQLRGIPDRSSLRRLAKGPQDRPEIQE